MNNKYSLVTAMILISPVFLLSGCKTLVDEWEVEPEKVFLDSQHDTQHTTGFPCISLSLDDSGKGCNSIDEGLVMKAGYIHDFKSGLICNNHFECSTRGRVKFNVEKFKKQHFLRGEKISIARLVWSSTDDVNLPAGHPHGKHSCLSKLYIVNHPQSDHPGVPIDGNTLMYPLDKFTELWGDISNVPFADLTSRVLKKGGLPPIDLVITGHDESIGNKDNFQCVGKVQKMYLKLFTGRKVLKWPGSE